jgi:hypothetical protein
MATVASTGPRTNTDTILDALLSAPTGIYSVTGLPYRGDGIAVAVKGTGRTLEPHNTPTTADVYRHVASWIERTAVPAVTTRPAPFHRPRYLAASITAGTVRLDVVEIFPREEIREAIAAAQDRNQAVIWDAGRQEVIDTTV